MKKICFLASVVLPLFFSCVNNGEMMQDAPQTISFEAQIEETKTQLGEKVGNSYPNYWSAGDAISVNGITSQALAADSPYVGTAKATFSVTGALSAPYYFAYPASAVVNYNGSSARIRIPNTQIMSSTTYDASAFVMVGRGSSSLLSFNAVMSVIKLTVPGVSAAKISSVMFESLGSEKVSGEFNTDFNGISATSNSVRMVNVYAPGDGLAFGGTMYILVPAQTYASGIRFTVRATDGTQMTFSTSNSFAALPGAVYPLTTRSYTPDPTEIPEGMMVMSSNVRFASARGKSSNPDTGERDWNYRKVGYYSMVNWYRPAILCLQEAEKEQVADIKNNCTGYGYYGESIKLGSDILRDSGLWDLYGSKNRGESSTIFYRTDLISLGSHGTIWHSDTPNSAGSYFSEMSDGQPQASTWAIMTYKPTNTSFFLINVHLSLYDSRPKEISLILNTVASKNTGNLPVILTGDWNLVDGDSWLNPVENAYKNARHYAQKTDWYGTYHWWGTESKLIDHIYYGGIGNCFLFHTDNIQWNNRYISDHYPVFAVFDLNSSTTTVPVADFNVPDNIQIDREVRFDDSSTSASGIAYREWDFGGIRSNEQSPVVCFRSVGSDVPVRLTVVDNSGQTATVTKLVTVESSDDHKLTQAWRRVYDSTEGATAYWTSPAVNAAGNRIYVSSSGYHLVGFNASGSQIGSYDIGKYGAYISGSLNCQTPTPSIDVEGNVYIPAQYSTGGSGSGGLFCLKGDLSAERWYVNTGADSQYRTCIPAVFGNYVCIQLTNVDSNLFNSNMIILNRYDGSLNQTLSCDKGSFGGIAVAADGTFVFGAARGGSDGGKAVGEESGAGYKVALLDGVGSWKTSPNSDGGRASNLLGMAHSDGYGYRTKGFQPAISTIDGSVYVAATTDDNKMICARYSLSSYVANTVPTPIWKVEVSADASNYGLGCVLDEQGNAYYRAADKVFKLNAADGALAWEFVTSSNAGNCGVPAIDNLGYVYVTDRSKQLLLKLSPLDGSIISQTKLSITPRTSPTIDYSGNIYVCGTSVDDEGAVLYKITCPKTTGPGANWSQLGGNPMKSCMVPGATEVFGGSASHEGYTSGSIY